MAQDWQWTQWNPKIGGNVTIISIILNHELNSISSAPNLQIKQFSQSFSKSSYSRKKSCENPAPPHRHLQLLLPPMKGGQFRVQTVQIDSSNEMTVAITGGLSDFHQFMKCILHDNVWVGSQRHHKVANPTLTQEETRDLPKNGCWVKLSPTVWFHADMICSHYSVYEYGLFSAPTTKSTEQPVAPPRGRLQDIELLIFQELDCSFSWGNHNYNTV